MGCSASSGLEIPLPGSLLASPCTPQAAPLLPTSLVYLCLSSQHHLDKCVPHVHHVLGAVWGTGGGEQTGHTCPRGLMFQCREAGKG